MGCFELILSPYLPFQIKVQLCWCIIRHESIIPSSTRSQQPWMEPEEPQQPAEILQMNSQLLLWSWKVADCSLVDNLIAKKLILPTFRLDAPVLLRVENWSIQSKCWQDKFLCYQVVYRRTVSNFPTCRNSWNFRNQGTAGTWGTAWWNQGTAGIFGTSGASATCRNSGTLGTRESLEPEELVELREPLQGTAGTLGTQQPPGTPKTFGTRDLSNSWNVRN